jgi:hypothetical protein
MSSEGEAEQQAALAARLQQTTSTPDRQGVRRRTRDRTLGELTEAEDDEEDELEQMRGESTTFNPESPSAQANDSRDESRRGDSETPIDILKLGSAFSPGSKGPAALRPCNDFGGRTAFSCQLQCGQHRGRTASRGYGGGRPHFRSGRGNAQRGAHFGPSLLRRAAT